MKLRLLEDDNTFEDDIDELNELDDVGVEQEETIDLNLINKKLDLILSLLQNKPSTVSNPEDADISLTESLSTMIGTSRSPLSGVNFVGGDIRDEMFGGATGAALGEFGNNGIPTNIPFSDVTMISSTDENI